MAASRRRSRASLLLGLVVKHWPPCGLTVRAAAARVGVDESSFWRWMNGLNKPPLLTALRVQEVFGVAVELWDEPAARLD